MKSFVPYSKERLLRRNNKAGTARCSCGKIISNNKLICRACAERDGVTDPTETMVSPTS